MTMPPSSLLFAILRRISGYRRLVLRQADRLTASVEADIQLSRWVARDPDHLALRWRHALEAHHRGLYAEALQRWNAIRARWPDEAFGAAAPRTFASSAESTRLGSSSPKPCADSRKT